MDERATEAAGAQYRVLARKYRPATFADLIGQEPMVRTMRNAFAAGRIAHAFMLTGVRGVGKTTTARIIAKGLNCIGPDGAGGPTIAPCGVCEPCRGIAEGRHVDVLEMDAASRTGVGDIREIIDSVAYRAASARYKVYIVDEVHMLSASALQCAAKDARGAPRAREVPVRHDRNPQGARDRPVAMPAVRPAADRAGDDARASGTDRGGRGGGDRAGRARADRARVRGIGARRAEPDGPGDRARRRRDGGGAGARDARARGPRARARPVRGGYARRRGGRARRTGGAVRRRGGPVGGVARSRRGHALGFDGQDRRGRGGRPDGRARRTRARAGFRRAARRCGR